jgi:preprotein translocase subunit SecD
MRTIVPAMLGIAVAVLTVTACTSSASTAAPSGTPAAPTGFSSSSAPVAITLSPVAPASAHELAAAAQMISERVARSGLPVLSATAGHSGAATVSGPDVVLTGLATDKAALEGLAGMGVLRFRRVLLQEPAGGQAYGDAGLVQPRVLRLFRKLVCSPGESDAAWQRAAGYTTSADWDDPAAQVVSCSSGSKYVLDVAAVLGQEVTGAVPAPSQPSGQSAVALTVNSAGASAFSALTTHLYRMYFPGTTTGNQDDMALDQVAVVLDGAVLSAPETFRPIIGGHLEIVGNLPAGLTHAAASELAAELQSGPLPMALRVAGTSTASQPASS